MNIGFFDPISERWIKPRPEKEREPVPTVSMGEALLAAVEEKARQDLNAKIWALLKQSAQGCNISPNDEAEPTGAAPMVVETPPEYVPEFSHGYIYWKPKDDQCSGQPE